MQLLVVQSVIEKVVKLLFEILVTVASGRRQLAVESLKLLVVQWAIQNVVKLLFEALVAIGQEAAGG